MTAAEPTLDYTVRHATEADRKFIVETTASVRFPHGMAWHDWERAGKQDATRIFTSGTSKVAEIDGVLVGFALWDGEALAMLYVKKDFRGLGIGLSLLGRLPALLEVTKPTGSWRAWTRRHGLKWVERR